MSVGTKIDKALEFTRKHPLYSGLTAAFGIAAFSPNIIGANTELTNSAAFAALFASPALTAINTSIAGVNILRPNRSLLSKAFSGTAIAGGIASGAAFAHHIDSSGWDFLNGFFWTSVGMVGTALANTAAHYTSNTGPTFGLKVEVKKEEAKEDTKIIFKSSRAKNEIPQTPESSVQSPEM
ncbi:MAG: hypothetical protein ACLFR0_02700 [Alphaproteobacteria bacterium]